MKKYIKTFMIGIIAFSALSFNIIKADTPQIKTDRFVNPNYFKVDTQDNIPWVLQDANHKAVASASGPEFDTNHLKGLPDGTYHLQTLINGQRLDQEFILKTPPASKILLDEGNNPLSISFEGQEGNVFEWEIQHLTSIGTEDHYWGSGMNVPAVYFDDIKKVEGTYEIKLTEVVTSYMSTTTFKNFQVIFPEISVEYDSLENPTYFRASGKLGRPIIHWQITNNYQIINNGFGNVIDQSILNSLPNGNYELEMYEANRYGSMDVVTFNFEIKKDEPIPPIIEEKPPTEIKPIPPTENKPTPPEVKPIIPPAEIKPGMPGEHDENVLPSSPQATKPKDHVGLGDQSEQQQTHDFVNTGITQGYKGYIIVIIIAVVGLIAFVIYNKSKSKKD